ncbi:hypothetical protein K440DRAFT_282446 [Wilcoxina mikolae CBS 423.85]|nr:hypothetical protein K440DRAFT_282446 [Wilcoxina mikolae CBS 423.85]
MYLSPISECYPLSFAHAQRQDEVSNRFQQNTSTAEPGSECYNWGAADPICTRSAPWCDDVGYHPSLEDLYPGYSGIREDHSIWTASSCLERSCDASRSHTNHQRSGTASSGHVQPQPFQCNHCQKNFPKKADRDRHEFSVHREKMRTTRGLIDCPEKGCPRRDSNGFTRKDNLLDHRRRVHNRNIPKRNHASGGRSVRR